MFHLRDCLLICQKPARFLSALMAWMCSFPQMFIVLGMYNFTLLSKTFRPFVTLCKQELMLGELYLNRPYARISYSIRNMNFVRF